MKNRTRLLSSTALVGASFTAAMGLTAIYAPAPANAAAGLSSVTGVTYATQAVSAASGSVIWPGPATLTGSSSVSPSAFLTLSLPSTMTWVAAPTLSRSSHVGLSGNATGGGTSTITWTLTGSSSTGDTYVFSAFSINSGTALTTASTTGLGLTVNLAGGTASGNAGPSSFNAFYASSGWSATFAAGTAVTINTASPSNGSLFTVNGTTVTSRVGTLGNASFSLTNNAKQNDGATSYTLPTGTSAGLTVTGNFGQITRAYLSSGTCQTTVGGALPSGALSSSALASGSATFSGVVAGTTYTLCVENQGTSLIQQTTTVGATLTPTASVGSSAAAAATGIGSLAYSGNSSTLDYVTGGSSWVWYIRAVNPNATSSNIFAAVTKDGDSNTYAGQLVTTLAAGANALYSIDQISSVTGANLTANDRARIQFLSGGSVNISSLLVNAATSVIVPVSTR